MKFANKVEKQAEGVENMGLFGVFGNGAVCGNTPGGKRYPPSSSYMSL